MDEVERVARLLHDTARTWDQLNRAVPSMIAWESLQNDTRARYLHVATVLLAHLAPVAKEQAVTT